MIKQLYILVILFITVFFIRLNGQIINNEQVIKLCDDSIIKTYIIEQLSGYDYYFEFIPEPEIINQNQNTITVRWENIGTYILIAKYIGDYCDSKDTKIIINITDCPITTFYVPNSFSPNGDGINDTFQPKGINILEYSMFIYNRWGELIFQSNELLKGWNGTYKNLIVQDDVYVYLIIYKGLDLKVNYLRGKITLLK
jgi:gliding motility-associated-like protein